MGWRRSQILLNCYGIASVYSSHPNESKSKLVTKIRQEETSINDAVKILVTEVTEVHKLDTRPNCEHKSYEQKQNGHVHGGQNHENSACGTSFSWVKRC